VVVEAVLIGAVEDAELSLGAVGEGQEAWIQTTIREVAE